MKMNMDEIEVNGVTYVPKGSRAPAPTGSRYVIVLDRGWVFAGDIVEEESGRVKVVNVIHVRRWSSVGFDGMVADPGSGHVTLKKVTTPLSYPEGAELFRISVSDGWGVL
ncbi:MAG: hypothetical protein P1V36_01650 [Planctomycetota bacterium]|nr:hypothetical protein [Planctomycetota bacterium]